MAMVEELAAARTPARETARCERCGHVADSDPSMMLGLVILVVANAFVVLALAAAIAWLVT